MGLRMSAAALSSVRERLAAQRWKDVPLQVFIGDPPLGVKAPYVFIWARSLPRESVAVDDFADTVDVPVNVQVVDDTPLNVLSLSDLVTDALEGFTPSAQGWRFAPLRVGQSGNIQTASAGAIPATSRPPSWCTLTFRVRGSKYREIGEGVG